MASQDIVTFGPVAQGDVMSGANTPVQGGQTQDPPLAQVNGNPNNHTASPESYRTWVNRIQEANQENNNSQENRRKSVAQQAQQVVGGIVEGVKTAGVYATLPVYVAAKKIKRQPVIDHREVADNGQADGAGDTERAPSSRHVSRHQKAARKVNKAGGDAKRKVAGAWKSTKKGVNYVFTAEMQYPAPGP